MRATLPSAKPSRPLSLSVILSSALMAVIGIGLTTQSIHYYDATARRRVSQSDQLQALDREFEIRQRRAQLQRNQSAPVWITGVFDPNRAYEVQGTSAVEVPVIVGLERDEAVCIGYLGPDGFTQDRDSSICIGY